jgi:hypothetical protein
VNDPVASCFRFSEIEHAAMVAGPAAGAARLRPEKCTHSAAIPLAQID